MASGLVWSVALILTVTPNASIDKTYVIDGFAVDRMHRPSMATSAPGGKGINVLRVFRELGGDGIATGFVAGRVGESIEEGLASEGMTHDLVHVAGESRLCIKIVDPHNGTQTEVNEVGPSVTPVDVAALMERIDRLLCETQYIVLSGNLPPGAPISLYGDIIAMAKSRGVSTVLDASEENLKESIKAGPHIVKPNTAELSQLAGCELMTVEEIVGAAKGLKQYGVDIAAVTMGRSGAIVTDGTHAWQAVPPPIKFASAVGSGDSFVAAFLYASAHGAPLQEALALATAAGAANATTYNAGFCSKSSIMECREGVVLTELG